jgi:hypothetical protein
MTLRFLKRDEATQPPSSLVSLIDVRTEWIDNEWLWIQLKFWDNLWIH